MRLDKQSILSDAQSIVGASGATIKSTNSIDLGQTGMIHGFSASAATNGRVPIKRKIGSKGQRFMGQIVKTVVGATRVDVNFVVGTGVVTAEGATKGQINAGRKLLSTVRLDGLTAGTSIPWPNIPRYLTERYFAVEYVLTGAATDGAMTAGFVEDVPEHEI